MNKGKVTIMKKQISFLMCLLLVALIAFTGCTAAPAAQESASGSQEAAASEPATAEASAGQPQEDVTLSFIHWRSEDADIYKEINKMFEEENPGIKIQMDVKSANQEEYYSVLKTKLSGSNDSVDVFAVHAGARLTELVNAGKVLDLTGKPVVDSYNAEMLGFGKIEDQVYGLPQAYNSYLIFLNKAIFDENGIKAPANWAEMQEVTKTLKDKKIGTVAAGLAEDWVFDMVFLPLLAAYNPDNPKILRQLQDGEVKFSDPTVKKVYEDIQAMGKEGFFQDGAQGTKYEASLALFAQGNAAMLLTGTWSIGGLKTQAPDLQQGYFLLPAQDAQQVMLADASQLMAVNAGSKNQDAALKYVEFLSRPEIAKMYSEATGQLSPVNGVKNDMAEMQEVTDMLSKNTVMNNPNLYLTNSKFIEIYTNTCAKAFMGEDLDTILNDAQKATDAL